MEENRNNENISEAEARLREDNENTKIVEAERERKKKIWKQQLNNCVVFFNRVAALVDDIYEVVPGKGKQWQSYCLVPKGTRSQINYYGKPVDSLRVAMNWNWRASLYKCSVPNHIQCVTQDLPFVKARPKDHPDLASPPVYGNMVALFDKDHKYHCLYGEKYDRVTKTWGWVDDKTPEDVANMLRERAEKKEQENNGTEPIAYE